MVSDVPTAGPGATRAAPAPPPRNPGAVLDRDDFLRLLVTQLRHQDPLSPLDQHQFLLQTAQFASLEQLMAISDGIQRLAAAPTGEPNLLQAAALLGTHAVAAGALVDFDGEPITLSVTVEGSGGTVEVDVLDAAGQRVRRLSAGPLEPGAHELVWDGRDDHGRALAPGSYLYRVRLVGDPVGSRVFVVQGQVTGVERRAGAVLLRIGEALVPVADLLALGAGPPAGGPAGPLL